MFEEVGTEISEMPYDFKKGPNGEVMIIANDESYAPPQISAIILQRFILKNELNMPNYTFLRSNFNLRLFVSLVHFDRFFYFLDML